MITSVLDTSISIRLT